MLKDFRAFIARGNVMDLAVGVIMGAAFTAIVTSLVNDVIMPPVGVLLGGIDFSDFFISLNGKHYATLAAAKAEGAPTLNYGLFVNAVIRFVIVAWCVFILVRMVVNRIYRQPVEAPPPPPQSKEELLLAEIRDILKARPQV